MKECKYDAYERKCLLMTLDDFTELLQDIYYPEEIFVDAGLDGLLILTAEDCVDDADLHARLAEYFCVDGVTSIHLDDCEVDTGVWIVCKSQTLTQSLGDGITILAEKYPDSDYKDICISLQDDRTGILIQDLCTVSPIYDKENNPLHGRYKVSVYEDPSKESPTQTFPIGLHCLGKKGCPCPLGKGR